MDSKEQRSALRAAVYRGDGRAVVDLLGGVGAGDDSLQLAGDGLIAAVMQRVDGPAELARGLVVGLRRRGWEGDDELADQCALPVKASVSSRRARSIFAVRPSVGSRRCGAPALLNGISAAGGAAGLRPR